MPVETATFISDLNTSNPAHSDGLNQADAHMRMIKATLKATFGHTGQISNSDNQLILLDGTSTKPAYSFASEPTLGFYRSASGLIIIGGGRLEGNGAVPVGSLHQFPKEPPGLVSNGTAGGVFLELNAATYQTADYPRLASFLGATGSTFTLAAWDVTDTGRFLRSRTSALAAGTRQSNILKTHAIAVTGTTEAQGAHAHNVSGSTGADTPDHSHGNRAPTQFAYFGGSQQQGPIWVNDGTEQTGGASTRHAHLVSGSTDAQGIHAHAVTATGTVTGDTETRPEALSVIICIKT